MSLSSSLLSFCFFVPTLIPLTEVSRNNYPYFHTLQFIFCVISIPNWIYFFLYIFVKKPFKNDAFDAVGHIGWRANLTNLGRGSRHSKYENVFDDEKDIMDSTDNESFKEDNNQLEINDTEEEMDRPTLSQKKSAVRFSTLKNEYAYNSSRGGAFSNYLFIFASLMNLFYCSIMLILKLIYINTEKSKETLLPTASLPWWTLIVQLLFSTSGPCIELLVRMESGNPRVTGNFALDVTLRIGFALAWLTAVVSQYWGAVVISVIGVVLSVAWQHSLKSEEFMKGNWYQNIPNTFDSYHTSDRNSKFDQTVGRKNKFVSKKSKKLKKKTTSKSNLLAYESREAISDNQTESSSTVSLYMEEHTRKDLNRQSATLFSSLASLVIVVVYILQFAAISSTYFAFLRLSSLFISSRFEESGYSFKWYHSVSINSAAGFFVITYLLLLHTRFMQIFSHDSGVLLSTILSALCLLPIPGIHYFALRSNVGFEILWYIIYLLLPLYHVSATMATLSIRRRIFECIELKDFSLTHTTLTVLWGASVCVGVTIGSVFHQLFHYYFIPQVTSYLVIGLVHVGIICISIAKMVIERLFFSSIGTNETHLFLEDSDSNGRKKSSTREFRKDYTSDDSSEISEDDLFRPVQTNLTSRTAVVEKEFPEASFNSSNLLDLDENSSQNPFSRVY